MASTSRVERTDALVVGGGPIGLLVAAQLLKFKCSAIVVERDDKPSMPIYGRATTLWCRTLELLDQLDLCEPLMEHGCFTKDGVNFRHGHSAPGGLTFGQVRRTDTTPTSWVANIPEAHTQGCFVVHSVCTSTETHASTCRGYNSLLWDDAEPH